MNTQETRDLLHKHIDALTDEQLEQISGGAGINIDPDMIAKYAKELKDLYEKHENGEQS